MNNQAGKGDKPRPVNKIKYNSNFDEIEWKTSSKKESLTKKGKTTYKY